MITVSGVLSVLIELLEIEYTSIYKILLILVNILLFLIYRCVGVYKESSKFYVMAFRITTAWIMVMLLLVIISYISNVIPLLESEVLVAWFLLVLVIQIPLLKLNYMFVRYYRRNQVKPINCIVFGLGKTARLIASRIDHNMWLPDKVIGMVNAYDGEEIPEKIKLSLDFPLLGDISDIRNILEKNKIQRIYLALPLKYSARVEELNHLLSEYQVDLIWVLDISDWPLMNPSIREISGFPIVSLNESLANSLRVQIRIKHFFDKLVSLISIVLLLPVFVAIASAVMLSSKGPIIFKQKRHGFNDEEIIVFKFRSMVEHVDNVVLQAQKNDKRVTQVGSFLRKTSLDELPQLFNVLLGSMSLVGPRPHAVKHNTYYSNEINNYMLRHRIKPGITGLAQVNGCRGETETLEKMEERVKYDMKYINEWSLFLDLKILFKTPLSLFSKDIY
jgi:putative colanic acid biosynthesis UDP-glucose lipid carrier transferase